MVAIRAEFQGRFAWAIRPEDPVFFPLESLPRWSLLNPALYPKMELASAEPSAPKAKATFINEGTFYFISSGFFLVSDDNGADLTWEFWLHRLPAFATYLRSESKQASLNSKLEGFGQAHPVYPASVILPQIGDSCFTASWHLRTAIRGEHILRAGRQPLDARPPSYDTLLLDAIDSLLHEDYPTAFLLAAISMDHLSRMQAEVSFNACVDGHNGSNLLITFPSNTPSEDRRERARILFELLINERRPFKDFVHRVPLALTGRSLLKEKKDLFDTATRVYQTRNRVAHKELAFSDDSPRFFGCDEAIEAVNCAVRLADWFGVPANYAHPFDGVASPTTCHVAAP